MTAYDIQSDWSAKSLAFHTQAVLQGAFILAKAKGGPAIAAESIDHLRRYIMLLFKRPNAVAFGDANNDGQTTVPKQARRSSQS
jgi:hypothetical protein